MTLFQQKTKSFQIWFAELVSWFWVWPKTLISSTEHLLGVIAIVNCWTTNSLPTVFKCWPCTVCLYLFKLPKSSNLQLFYLLISSCKILLVFIIFKFTVKDSIRSYLHGKLTSITLVDFKLLIVHSKLLTNLSVSFLLTSFDLFIKIKLYCSI